MKDVVFKLTIELLKSPLISGVIVLGILCIIIDKIARKKHVKDVKKVKDQKEKDSINKCPKCGGELVERSGQYGKFMGCSNYPKCKFTKTVN